MKTEHMQKIYNDIEAFKDAMREHALKSAFNSDGFYDEFRKHADNMCEAMGTLSAYIAMQEVEEKVHG